MEKPGKIAIVIVNYKTPELVTECLRSLKETAEHLGIAVFIGDAESQDGSVEIISSYIDREALDWASCFAIGRNGGFAYGNNQVVTRCVLPDPDFAYVHFLNPDTYIRPGAVQALVQFLQDRPAAGIAGSRLENPDGSLRSFGFNAPAPWREFFRAARLSFFDRILPQSTIKITQLTEDRQVDWVTGASFMIRRDLLEKAGLMDDGYFLYFEETDLMTRVRSMGHEVWHVSTSHVVHLAGQSTGVRTDDSAPQIEPPSPFWLASRHRYLRKHHGHLGPLRANMGFFAGDILYRLHRKLRGRPIENPPSLWSTYMGQKNVSK